MIQLTPEQADEVRAAQMTARDGEMTFDVGFFIIWYSTAELGITVLLATASGITDLETFDTLCMGMDARVKIERLRKILGQKSGIGPNLDARLKYFDEKARLIRNRLAHSALSYAEKRKKRYFSASLSSLPWAELGMDAPTKSKPPIVIAPEALLGWGKWFGDFATDLSAAFNHAVRTGEFEIISPRSQVPLADQAKTPPKPRRATNDTRGRNPNKKAQL